MNARYVLHSGAVDTTHPLLRYISLHFRTKVFKIAFGVSTDGHEWTTTDALIMVANVMCDKISTTV